MTDRSKRVAVGIGIALLLLVIGGVVIWFATGRTGGDENAIRTIKTPDGKQILEKPAGSMPVWNGNQQGLFTTGAAIDAQGRPWIATEHQGVWVYDPQSTSGSPWRDFGAEDGLGENSMCAVAVDTQGRVWAGHLQTGVSVYDGKKWKHYGPTEGPLGTHVYDIAVCPANARNGAGDVWLVTDLGLARYSPAADSWSYFLRNNVIPTDRATSIAFDSNGDLYLGLQNEGVAMSQGGGNYQVWPRTYGPDRTPTKASGEGLPSRLINDVLVMRDDTVFAATASGLARSADHGKSWTFVRGADWELKGRKSIEGPPKAFVSSEKGVLAEDWVTCLAEDEAGLLWVGFRTKGYQCLDPKTMKPIHAGGLANSDYCTAIVPRAGEAPLLATRGFGVKQTGRFFVVDEKRAIPTAKLASDAALPSPAKAPTAEELRTMVEDVKKLAEMDKHPVATYLGEDWSTQGDWLGSYGREQAFWPNYGALAQVSGFRVSERAGSHVGRTKGYVYNYRSNPSPAKGRMVLYQPKNHQREMWEWNDGGWQEETFGPNWEGPDLWFDVTVPSGVHRVSVYIFNNDGEGKLQRRRDYPIELKAYTESIEEAEKAPALARARFVGTRCPVYKTFLLSEGRYWIRVASQYSNTVKVMAVFFDGVGDNAGDAAYLDGSDIGVPQSPAPSSGEGEQVKAARELWKALDGSWDRPRVADVQLPYRVYAYRAAAAGGVDEKLLANWRWELHWWSEEDHKKWEQAMGK